ASMKTRLLMAMLVTLLYACGADSPSSQAPSPQADSTPASISSDSSATVEATSFLGRPLLRQMEFPNRDQLEANLAAAEADYAANPGSADALIWLGRRQAYLWQYQDAIATFTRGVEQFPNDPRMYRHRGHRYITVRNLDAAIADFEKAAELFAGQPDEIEPDGQPNAMNMPRSTLQFNTW